MKTITACLILLLSTNLWAQKFLNKEIDSYVFKAESALRKEMTQILQEKTKRQDISLNVSLEVNKYAILQSKGISPQITIDPNAQLPGLDVDQNMISRVNQNIRINEEDVMTQIKKLNVDVESNSELDENLKQVITGSIEKHVKSLNILETAVTYSLIKLGKEEATNSILSNDEKSWINTDNLILGMLLLISLLVIAGILFAINVFKNSSFKLAEDLKSALSKLEGGLGSGMGGGFFPQSNPMGDNNNEGKEATLNVSRLQFANSYDLILQKIKNLKMEKPEGFLDLAINLTNKNFYEFMIVISDCLTLEEQESFYRRAGDKVKTKYHEFLQSEGSNYLTNLEKMSTLAQDFYNLLWISFQNKEVLARTMIGQEINRLDYSQLTKLMEQLNDQELGLVLKFTAPQVTAKIFFENKDLMKKFKTIASPDQIKEGVLLTIEEKLKKLKSVQQIDMLQKVSDLLPYELEKEFNKLRGATGTEFDKNTNSAIVFEFLNSLDMNQLVQILPAIPENLKDSYLASLPDIKRNRIKSKSMNLTENSLALKAKLHSFMREKNLQ
jgi:hypothetical protein